MLVPLIVGLGVLAVFKGKTKESKQGQMTAERTELFQSALNSAVLQPPHLEKLADAFQQQGLPAEAMLLRKRARLRGMSPQEKEQRKAIFRKALASNNPDAIEQVAAVYEGQGATGSAKRLREHAIGLRTAGRIKPVVRAPVEAPAEVVAAAVEEVPEGIQGKVESSPASSDEKSDGISEQQE